MLVISQLLNTLFMAINDFFIVLAEAETPEAWGECPIVIENTQR